MSMRRFPRDYRALSLYRTTRALLYVVIYALISIRYSVAHVIASRSTTNIKYCHEPRLRLK